MKSRSYHCHADEIPTLTGQLKDMPCDLVIVFAGKSVLEGDGAGDLMAAIRENCGKARLIGCSTSGELGSGVQDESVSLIAFSFDSTQVRCSHTPLMSIQDSHAAGKKIAQSLLSDDLAGIFVLAPGVNINGSLLVEGMRDVLPSHVSLSGGLAGDGVSFQGTKTLLDDQVFDSDVVAVGFYGKNISIRTSSAGGWKPFGPHRRVTKAEGSIVYEFDGKPALELYKQYLGDKAAQLPSSGLLYPFAIIDEKKREATGLIRTILDIDEEKNALIFAGNLRQGELVTLTHAGTEDLADGAGRAASAVLKEGCATDDSAAALCVSCVGRKILMGQDTEEELDCMRDAFGGLPLAGFYSYGEICYFETTARTELHNQTMTITYITET